MQFAIDSIAVALATYVLIFIWRKNDLFAGLRAFLEAAQIPVVSKLLGCTLCLSVWISLILLLLFVIPSYLVDSITLGCFIKLPVYWLASVFVVNDLTDPGVQLNN